MPGIGRVEIHRPDWLDKDDAVKHDDLIALVSDSKAGCRTVAALVTILRSPNGNARAGLPQAQDRRGLAELLDSVWARLALVMEGTGQVACKPAQARLAPRLSPYPAASPAARSGASD